jgi:hypothetical protein
METAPASKKGKRRQREQERERERVLLGVEDWVYFSVPHPRDQALVEGGLVCVCVEGGRGSGGGVGCGWGGVGAVVIRVAGASKVACLSR